MYDARDLHVVDMLTSSMIVLVSNVGGVPHDMGLQDGVLPDQLPPELQTLKCFLTLNIYSFLYHFTDVNLFYFVCWMEMSCYLASYKEIQFSWHLNLIYWIFLNQ